MPIGKPEGALKRTHGSPQSTPFHETPLTLPNNHMASGDKNHAELANVQDTFTTRTAVNPKKFNDEYAMLLAYPEGTPIVVTYFHRNISDLMATMIEGEMDPSEDAIHTDLTEIHDYEMRLITPVEASFSDDNREATGGFVIVTYPGFTPYEGDVFFYDIGDGHIAECRVDQVDKTTYRQNAYHRLQIQIIGTLNKDRLKFYNDRVIDHWYFDKNYYFNHNFTFLRHSSYVTLEDLRAKRTQIVQYYFDKFWLPDAQSIMHPAGHYDPYLVEFLLRKTNAGETGRRPTQLITHLPDYDKSIWYLLMDSFYGNVKSLSSVFYMTTNIISVYATRKNWMVNKQYVTFEAPTSKNGKSIERIAQPYVLSEHFYNETTMLMTQLEKLVYNAKVLKTINSPRIVQQIHDFRSLSDETAFYYLPLYLYLIDVAVTSLMNP